MSIFWKSSLLVLGVVLTSTVFAQSNTRSYIIKFTNKHNSPYSLNHPSEFLSSKTVDKRIKHHIGFDERDLPVNPFYVEQIQQLCHCQITNKTKWFNAVVIRVNDNSYITAIEQLPFVKEVHLINSSSANRDNLSASKLAIEDVESTNDNYTEGMYGKGMEQIEMLNGHLLHEIGFDGKGIDLAILDAGFILADKLPVFENLYSEGRIKMTRDFAFGSGDEVYNWSTHGTSVLSILTGNLKDSLIGTAPKANYFLFRTENVTSESLEEEYNWAAAAELCDSLGIDIISTSLGYSVFDDTLTSHTYADMDGNTTVITIAADIAASKGMLVINSAGNEGDDAWHYITAPADGDSVLTIGAVNMERQHAFFSSYGPSYDGRIKPNVATMGEAAAYAAQDSTIKRGNGTSFSAPVLSGMAACLWQAFPDKNSMEIFRAIEQSAHLYHNPNDELGYGIPDFWRAFLLLQSETKNIGELQVQLFPNPCADYLNIILNDDNPAEIRYTIYDISGRKLYRDKGVLTSGSTSVLQLNTPVRNLADGNYILHLETDEKQSIIKFVKIKER